MVTTSLKWVVSITCTHAAECSLAGSLPVEGSGSSPSPPWTLSSALCPPAVRLGPFPSSLTRDQPEENWRYFWEVVTVSRASHPLHSPMALHSHLFKQGKFSHLPPRVPRSRWDNSPRLPLAVPDLELHRAPPHWAAQLRQENCPHRQTKH